MASILKTLRLLADPTRVRIVLLLEREELSVTELQEVLGLGQSTLSTHLAQLKQAGMAEDRRTGKNIFYRLKDRGTLKEWASLLKHAATEIAEAGDDREALALALARRRDKARAYFDGLAGRFGRQYVPGRSWQAMAEMLLALAPPLVIADLGAGEGTLALLLARRAKKVVAVDNSEKMIEFGRAAARRQAVRNLDYRRGDLEALPIRDASVDVALLSQSLHHAPHPDRAVAEAYRIVRPGGQILVLDLARHRFEEARDLYADLWLGFSEVELRRLLRQAGFREIRTSVVHREAESPFFETVLASARK